MSQEKAQPAPSPFERVGEKEFGYNTKQVDVFLSRARATFNGDGDDDSIVTSHMVRRTVFPAQRGGYSAREVDGALDRLEDVFAQRERDALIQSNGEDAWLQQVGRLSAILRGRLHRSPGERFNSIFYLRNGAASGLRVRGAGPSRHRCAPAHDAWWPGRP